MIPNNLTAKTKQQAEDIAKDNLPDFQKCWKKNFKVTVKKEIEVLVNNTGPVPHQFPEYWVVIFERGIFDWRHILTKEI
ncbi:hypothetical protein [Xanthomarina gelatinilytica]|uniref:hypothetical protein n=1 Tax=Xanthomarina gelatinilytica TaxID=1137281 RepID=UPI003AA7ABFF